MKDILERYSSGALEPHTLDGIPADRHLIVVQYICIYRSGLWPVGGAADKSDWR